MYIHFWSSNFDIAHNISHIQTDRFLIHTHPFYELLYVLSGDVTLLYDGRKIPVSPHCLTLIAPNVTHGLKVLSPRSYDRYTVHFTKELLSSGTEKELLQIFSPNFLPNHDNHLKNMNATNVLRYFQDLVMTEKLTAEIRNQIVPPLVKALVACIYLNISTMEYISETHKNCSYDQDVMSYVNQYYKEPITLGLLADKFFCSKGHINYLFKKKTGTTVMSYIQHLRLAYAKVLLDNGYSATQAGMLSGFNEYSSFYRAYIKLYGNAPSNDMSTDRPASFEMLHMMSMIDKHKAEMAASCETECLWQMHSDNKSQIDEIAILHDT